VIACAAQKAATADRICAQLTIMAEPDGTWWLTGRACPTYGQ
jgi:hypothetical protein